MSPNGGMQVSDVQTYDMDSLPWKVGALLEKNNVLAQCVSNNVACHKFYS